MNASRARRGWSSATPGSRGACRRRCNGTRASWLFPPTAKVVAAGGACQDEAGLRLFESRGYRDVRHFFRMAIDLDAPPPEPTWASGLEPRPVAHEQLRDFHAAKEDAFADVWRYVPESFEASFRAKRGMKFSLSNRRVWEALHFL